MVSAAKRISAPDRILPSERVVDFSPEAIRAPFSLRCAALFIDYMTVIAIPVLWLVAGSLITDAGSNIVIGKTVWLFSLMVALVDLLLLPLIKGQSLGKMMVGLHVVRIDGSDINLMVILRRHILGYLVTILTLGVGFFAAALNRSGRTLHDLIAGTVVIRGRKTQV